MREIKFRGKKKNGTWLWGDFVQRPPIALIFPLDAPDSQDNYIVDLKTVGQFTGLTDKNGVEIYENDILKTNEADWIGKVEFKHSAYIISDNKGGYSTYPDFQKCEVIGNTFDNPELLQ